MVILGFVEDDHASVFALKHYWDPRFILVSDTKGRRGVLNFMVVGQATPRYRDIWYHKKEEEEKDGLLAQ